MKKKFGLWAALLILISALLLPGCAAPAPAPAPIPAPAPAPAPAPPPKMILRAATWIHIAHSQFLIIEEFAKKVEARTDGGIEIHLFPSESLVKGRDMLEATRKGLIDLGHISTSYFPGAFPFYADIACLPFSMSRKDIPGVTKALQEPLNEELAPQNVKLIIPIVDTTDFFSSKPLDLENPSFEGMKVRSIGGVYNLVVEVMGGAPVAMSSSEIPSAIRTGVIQAFITSYQTYQGRELYLDAPYCYVSDGFILMSGGWCMNMDTWNKLPAEWQKIVSEEGEKAGVWGAEGRQALDEEALAKAEAGGANIITLTDAQRELWRQKLEPVYQQLEEEHGAKFTKWLETLEKVTGK